MPTFTDPIVEEVHRIRQEIAEEYNYDLYAYTASIRAKEAAERERQQKRPAAK